MIEFLLPFALLQAAQEASKDVPLPFSPACGSDGHAGFDFWVGEWDVSINGTDREVGQSRIERTHDGCAVTENWMPENGQTGTSLNHYDSAKGQWHQKWVGSAPGAVEFVGGVVEGKMVMTGNWPSPGAPQALVRMTWSQEESGAVRQYGEFSTDHGLTWQSAFDYLYRPKANAE